MVGDGQVKEWCREFIEHHCIFRSPPDKHFLICGPMIGSWQFYMPVALLNQEFAHRIGVLFWEAFGESFKREPFQLCGCESGGALLVSILQDSAPGMVGAFMIKKQAKSYGLKNWLEGPVQDQPVMLIDDIVSSGRTIASQAARLVDFGLTLCPEAFAIASCKRERPVSFKVGDRDFKVNVLYSPGDFTKMYSTYVAKYARNPVFGGIVR
jgi:orotate phosphoribosyltransferase